MGKNYYEKIKTWPFALLIFTFIIFQSYSNLAVAQTPVTNQSSNINGLSKNELKRGERFFKGLLPFEIDYPSCVSCHNIYSVDTLNWNPSAMEIALKYATKEFSEFQAVIMEPTGNKMSEVHQQFDISEEDLKLVKGYLDQMTIDGYPKEKTEALWLIGLVILLVIILWALVELILIKKIKPKIITVIILLGAFSWLTKILVVESIKLGRHQEYAPLQPIKFSHEVHAGINETDCLYCHHTAETSKSAGIPSINICMNCHMIVRDGTNSGRYEIDKIHYAFENNIPVEWVKIHNLPDYVFFSHAQHISVGNLECLDCHGPVEEMNVLYQYNDLSMGWCLDCHRTENVQFLENEYYKTFKNFLKDITEDKIDSVTVEQIGGTDCMKCHY